ncbi:MAG: DUF4932 domain-containing protein [Candidatus Cloacimonetes bacterium]|nr:DUF4932 domain-containing protein [Candidatus Cloacimonadota bacterium]
MRIRLDQRLELIYAIMLLSGRDASGICVEAEDEFAQAARQKFGRLAAHPAVASFNRLWKTEIDWDTLPNLALILTAAFRLDPVSDPARVQECLASGEDLEEFTASLRDFFRAAGFAGYFSWLRSRLGPWLGQLNELIGRRPVQRILEAYLGVDLPPTEVLLCTLTKPFLSITISGKRGETVFCLCSRRGLEIAEKNGNLERVLLSAVWHEFSHHVINPLTYGLFEDIDSINDSQADWCCALNESIIWAINVRLLVREKIISTKDIGWMLKNAEANRAPHTRRMHEMLLDYELNRDKYPNIKGFHPQLAEAGGPPPDYDPLKIT